MPRVHMVRFSPPAAAATDEPRSQSGSMMSIFSRLVRIVAGGAGRLGAAFSGLRAVLAHLPDSELRRQAAFAIAMIGLSAKMAKADGVVTRSEVDAFCRMFAIPPGE